MRFLSVKGYEDLYEVSNTGVVRSLDRTVVGHDGMSYQRKGRVLRPHPHKDTQYLQVSLWVNNVGTSYYVHRLVAQAFLPNPLGLPEINHKDGNRQHNDESNLEWCTRKQNAQHAVRAGLRKYTHRMTRDQFIECLFDVIDGESYSSLSARTPYQVPFLSVKLRKLAVELQVDKELDASLADQRAERARRNGAQNR